MRNCRHMVFHGETDQKLIDSFASQDGRVDPDLCGTGGSMRSSGHKVSSVRFETCPPLMACRTCSMSFESLNALEGLESLIAWLHISWKTKTQHIISRSWRKAVAYRSENVASHEANRYIRWTLDRLTSPSESASVGLVLQ